jgi:hypothetical protein
MLTGSGGMIDIPMSPMVVLESGLLRVTPGTSWIVTYIFLLILVEFPFMGYPCSFIRESRMHEVRCAKGVGAVESQRGKLRVFSYISTRRRIFAIGFISIRANPGIDWA